MDKPKVDVHPNRELLKILEKNIADIKSGKVKVDHNNTASKILCKMRGSELVD